MRALIGKFQFPYFIVLDRYLFFAAFKEIFILSVHCYGSFDGSSCDLGFRLGNNVRGD